MIKMNKKSIINFIKKRKKEHKDEADPDGFAICPIEEQLQIRVPPKGGGYLGTKEERQEALKNQKIMDKYIGCEFCDLCDELIRKLRKESK